MPFRDARQQDRAFSRLTAEIDMSVLNAPREEHKRLPFFLGALGSHLHFGLNGPRGGDHRSYCLAPGLGVEQA
jgi:hypothetical protein